MRPARCVLAAALPLALAGCGLGTIQTIEKSMEPTIRSGEIVDLDTSAYDDTRPQVGDIVSLRAPRGAETETCGLALRPGEACRRASPGLGDDSYVKRIVAGPGDRVAIGPRGVVLRNGAAEDVAQTIPCVLGECELPRAIRVPAGHWFVMGDNRPYSSDSRIWGPVPTAAIEGRITPPDPSRR